MFLYSYLSRRVTPTEAFWQVVAFSTPSPTLLVEMQEWCYRTFGYPCDDIRWVDNIRYGEVMFVNTADLTLFLLKWS